MENFTILDKFNKKLDTAHKARMKYMSAKDG